MVVYGLKNSYATTTAVRVRGLGRYRRVHITFGANPNLGGATCLAARNGVSFNAYA